MGKNTIADKRNLIYWFLDSQRLANPSTEKILRRLLGSDELLERVRLTNKLPHYGNLLLIAAKGTETYPFLLRLNEQEIDDIEVALDLLESGEWNYINLYLALNRAFFCQQCMAGWQEEEPEKEPRNHGLTRQMLLAMIDQALDHRDRRAFEALSTRLQKLEDKSRRY